MALNARLDQLSGSENNDTAQHRHLFQNDILEDFLAELYDEDKNVSVADRELCNSLLGEIIKLEARQKVNITTTYSIDGTTHSLTNCQAKPCTSKDMKHLTPALVNVAFDIMDYWKKKKIFCPRLYRHA